MKEIPIVYVPKFRGVNLHTDIIDMRFTSVCFFLLMLPGKWLLAQRAPGRLLWQAKEIKMTTAPQKKGVKFSYLPGFKAVEHKPVVAVRPPVLLRLPADFYNEQLGWVCKHEWKLEQKTSIPLRLRLGSKEQVDYLEGKFDHRNK